MLAWAVAGCGIKTDTPEDRAEAMASIFNATKGVTAGSMAGDLSARAEGKYMILTIKNAMEGEVEFSAEEAAEAVTPMICNDKNYLGILEQGVGIKVEMFTNSGAAIPAVTVDKCPAPSGSAAT